MQKRESALSFILAAEDEEPLKSLLMEISNRPFSKIQNGDKRKFGKHYKTAASSRPGVLEISLQKQVFG